MENDLKIILLYTQNGAEQELNKALGSFSGMTVSAHYLGRGSHISSIEDIETADMVIYEMEEHSEADMLYLEEFIRQHENIPVYVMHEQMSMDSMRRLMRAGVRDTFPKPLRAHEVVGEVGKIMKQKKENGKSDHALVVSFMSAKGGCGATTMTINLGYELAFNHKMNVLIIDFDVQFGDVAMELDLKYNSTVMEALSQVDRIDRTMIKALATEYDSKLSILASPANIARISEIKSSDVRKLIEVARDVYDIVLLDLPRLFTGWTVEAIKSSDRFVPIIQRSLPVLRDAKAILEELPAMGVDPGIADVLENRHDSKHVTINNKQILSILGVDHLFSIRNDFSAAMSAQDQGQPVCRVVPRSHLSKDVKVLAEQVMDMKFADRQKHKGLFAKLFSKSA